MMNRKAIKIIFLVIILAALVGAGIGLYFYFKKDKSKVGQIEPEKHYNLSEIYQSDIFPGVTQPDESSYFSIDKDFQTGELYLNGLTASTQNGTTTPIPFIVTNYQESSKQTVIDFEFVINKGKDTKIQHLQAISTENEIRIKTVMEHNVYIIHQNQTKKDPEKIDYEMTLLVFKKEVTE